MIRYTKQRRRLDCGPAAIANALKWAGSSFSYADSHRDLVSNCCAWNGASPIRLDAELRRWQHEGVLRSKLWFRPTLKRIEEQLSKGGAIILDHAYERPHRGHYAFVSDLHQGEFLVSNEFSDTETTVWVPRRLFKERLLRRMYPGRSYVYGSTWFLTRI